MPYKIITERTPQRLEDRLNELANQNWQAMGSITQIEIQGRLYLTVLMWRYKKRI